MHTSPGSAMTASSLRCWGLISGSRKMLPKSERPALLRGDVAYGNESVLREAEAHEQPYPSKLRLTKRVKGLIQTLFRSADWTDAGQGWEGLEDTLTLAAGVGHDGGCCVVSSLASCC